MSARYIPAIASQSLGRAWHHSLEKKLRLAAKHGFKAVEIFFEDLDYLSESQNFPSTYIKNAQLSASNRTTKQQHQIAAASFIADLCRELDLFIICLQPFMHYDGLVDRTQHAERIEELHFWIELAKHLDTDLIQIPSSFLSKSECTGDRAQIVADLREAADIGLQQTPVVRFAYEALCWGTHIDTWDAAWDVVQAVDRPNFGTCLDTFNIAGRIFADPAAKNGSGTNTTAIQDTITSISKLRNNLDISKVFYVEVCDGERLDAPLDAQHPWYKANQPSRMTWSRNARLFPFEEPGYLPYLEILDAILDAGYEGPISFELFNRSANKANESVPEDHARRGEVSWNRLLNYIESREVSNSNVKQSTAVTGLKQFEIRPCAVEAGMSGSAEQVAKVARL